MTDRTDDTALATYRDLLDMARAGAPRDDIVPAIMRVMRCDEATALSAYLANTGAPRAEWDDVID